MTSDEILRGERRNTPNPSDEINSEKAKKQLHSLINKSKVKFLSSSIISAGIAGVGLIAAMIANFGFSRAHIGFFIGCVFYLVALICESVCWLITTSALRMEGAEIKELQVVKDSITKWFTNTLIIILCIFVSCLPLVFSVPESEVGLYFGIWFKEGGLAAAIVFIVCKGLSWLISQLSKKISTFLIPEEIWQKDQLKWNFIKRTGIVIIMTFALQGIFNYFADPSMFIPGTTFDNYADFLEYIEKGVTEDGTPVFADQQTYYDDLGNEISEEEALTSCIYDNGEISLTYLWRNRYVSSMRYGDNGGGLPITVWTNSDYDKGMNIIKAINTIWVFAYITEIALGIALYFRKKNKTL